MLRTSLSLAAVALVFLVAHAGANPPDDVKSALAVQQAMERAEYYKSLPSPKKRVEVLEEQLSRINGNPKFLEMLRDAYRSYIRELWIGNQGPIARKYLERLCIIDASAAQDPILNGGAAPGTEVKTPPVAEKKPGGPTFRAKGDDPFDPSHQLVAAGERKQDAKQLLATAEAEFARRRFAEARVFYERAYQADPQALDPCRDRWAYCMLTHVVDQLNHPEAPTIPLPELQKQVHGAVALSPSLRDTGTWLLREIDQRSRTQVAGTGPEVRPDPTVNVQHLGTSQGWQIAETANFRIYHNQSREQVEKIALVSEKTRREMFRKWFDTDGAAWSGKCDLYLHATAGDYSRITGVPSNSPGHSRIETDPSGQRVIGRRMDMHCDVAGMLETVLPHETTHVVLAGMFGQFAVPRWADEGVAVLTEPAEKIDQHRRNLQRCQRDVLFGVKELMTLSDYPHPRRISAFYAQSVFLVEFLARQRGPLVFTEFLRDGLREGYESSLRRHYNWSFQDVETRWAQYLQEPNTPIAQSK